MKKLRIAILWHFHQPYYKSDNEFILPWVRLHGVKDYLDLPQLFYEYPKVKQTVNIVPSFIMQINDYLNNEAKDKIQILTLKEPAALSHEEKNQILRLFFLCNPENMIFPYPRFKELFIKKESNPESFSDSDFLDLQVWYNLCWLGNYSKQKPAAKMLFNKERNYTEKDKKLLLELHNEILREITTNLKTLNDLEIIDISTSPMYHPILPLLIDTKSVLENSPHAILPNNIFAYPEDADKQISNAAKYFEQVFGNQTVGMWPSEGSLSNSALTLMAKNGIKWAASDEMLLFNTIGYENNLLKYFPYKFKTVNGDITLFFRDHSLSDAIGFTYSNWNGTDAANDFIGRLNSIKNDLIESYGENILDEAIVPIILDGENCWEYYFQNGEYFLRELFSKLSSSDEIETVFFKDLLSSENQIELSSIKAGSWINANFDIWAGHLDHRLAWSELSIIRKIVQEQNLNPESEIYNEVMEMIYIAEGSDWFWWYGDTHWAENKYDFDVFFRNILIKIYNKLKIEAPEILFSPINTTIKNKVISQPIGFIEPNFMNIDSKDWEKAGVYYASSSMSAMHQIGELLDALYFGNSADYLYFRLDLKKVLTGQDTILLKFNDNTLEIKDFSYKLLNSEKHTINSLINSVLSSKNTIIIQVNKRITNSSEIKIKLITISDSLTIEYPNNSELSINFFEGEI